VLRGLLDLVSPPSLPKCGSFGGFPAGVSGGSRSANGKNGGILLCGAFAVVALAGSLHASPSTLQLTGARHRRTPAGRGYFRPVAALAAQGQFARAGAGENHDGTNNLVVDPCKGQTKLYISINQTAIRNSSPGRRPKRFISARSTWLWRCHECRARRGDGFGLRHGHRGSERVWRRDGGDGMEFRGQRRHRTGQWRCGGGRGRDERGQSLPVQLRLRSGVWRISYVVQ